MKQTPLHSAHRAAHAKLVDFAGWDMPLQYSGVVDEYQTVRHAAGLFDVSHMGRIGITGPGASAFLNGLATNDVSKIRTGQSQYSMLCNERGGIKDDIFIYAVDPQDFLLCINASNRDKIVTWLRDHWRPADDCLIRDRSEELAQLALQGPRSRAVLSELQIDGLSSLKPRDCLHASLFGEPALVARTGYTGELGYELYLQAPQAARLWDRLMDVGTPMGVKPAGLGARDLLRLEMGYLLYGNDIDEETTPLEAGAEWVVRLDKGPFIGSEALSRQRTAGPTRRLVGFELLEKAVPRHGCSLFETQRSDRPIGTVTSGNFSPLLQKGIGMGYVPPAQSATGTHLYVDIRGKRVPACVTKAPFYKKPTPP